MLPRDQEAFDLYQANRNSPEIEALLDAFFSFPTRVQYEEQLQCVSEAMSQQAISSCQF